jgi:LysR family hydrogen peroxide-inducible transcriptional activator
MISLKQLHYALAVEKTLHFKKAAEMCHVSQSALSTGIAELEKQLGMPIFERDNKKVLISPFGSQFLEKARAIKTQLDDLDQLAAAMNKPLSYPMAVGVIPTIGPYLLPKVLPLVRSRYPDFRLRIVEDQTDNLILKVRSGELDAAILALPYRLDGLLAFEFWTEDFYWIVHRDDALAKRKGITSHELSNVRLMLLEDGHCLRDHALAACKLQGADVDNTFASSSLNTLIQMVAGHMGTTLVPQMALDQLLTGSSELKAIHLNEPGPHRRIAFVTRPDYAGVKSIELLISLFRTQLKKIK